MGNIYFRHKSSHKYTRVDRCQDGVEVMSMIDMMLAKKDMVRYVQDVRAVKRMERGLLDSDVVLYKVRLTGARIKRREVVNVARRITSNKLREPQAI